MKTSIKMQKTKEVLSFITDIAFSNVPCWYDAARRDLHMDLIVPKNRQSHAECPVVIWICGGAYMVVNHSVWLPEMVRFARAGYVVTSFVMGESAGGTMACLIGATADQKEYDQGDYLEYDSSVKGGGGLLRSC